MTGIGSWLRKWAPSALLWAWAAPLVVLGGSLSAAHFYALPLPSVEDARLAQGIGQLRTGGSGLLIVHALYARCRCSRRLAEHLLQRGPIFGTQEAVLLVEETSEGLTPKLRARGFSVTPVSELEFRERYGMEAAPAMVILDARQRIIYLGGHSDRKQSLAFQDESIVQAALVGRRVPPLPVLGCAVSRNLQQALDPLAVKYR